MLDGVEGLDASASAQMELHTKKAKAKARIDGIRFYFVNE
jgi:hypothetical protein